MKTDIQIAKNGAITIAGIPIELKDCGLVCTEVQGVQGKVYRQEFKATLPSGKVLRAYAEIDAGLVALNERHQSAASFIATERMVFLEAMSQQIRKEMSK